MKNIFPIILLISSVKLLHSQTEVEKTKQRPSVAIGAGLLSFDGDLVNDGAKIISFANIKAGYNITIEQRIGKHLGVSLNGIYGKLSDSEQSRTRSMNFQSTIIQADLNIQFHFDNDLIFNRERQFAPYLFVGFGYLQYDPYEDLIDKNGEEYHYWNDGSIRSVQESDINAAKATVLHRDYKYETKRVDSFAHTSFAVPVGLACNLRMLDNLSVNIGASYYFTFTDGIDNVKSGKNDNYLFANVSVQYSFTKRGKDLENPSKKYENVDFSLLEKLDSDEDGIIDIDDQCQSTPKGVKVDSHGCPVDEDEDGIPDYRDKELTTKKGALVDANGVTQTAKMTNKNNSEATERSDVFNQNPSLAYLMDIDFEALSGKRTKTPIPALLKAADINNDGYITSVEMKATIEGFFEGVPDFTAERLNALVDFYFEQIK